MVIYDDVNGVAPNVGIAVLLGQSLAMPFLTGSSALTLTQVEAYLGFGSGDAAGTGLTVRLYADAAGLPGAPIVTLSPAGPLTSFTAPSLVSFVSATPTILAAGTRYWVTAMTSGPNYGWLTSGSPGGFAVSNNNVTWHPETTLNRLAMRVTADDGAAPELSVSAPGFAAMGLLLLLGGSRRRRVALAV